MTEEPQVTEQPTKRSIAKPLIWTGSIAAVLVIILIVLHFWLGTWVVLVWYRWDFADEPCRWAAMNLPLWLVGKGLAASDPHSLTYRDDADSTGPYLLRALQSGNPRLRESALRGISDLAKGRRIRDMVVVEKIYPMDKGSRVWQDTRPEILSGYGGTLAV